MLKMRLQRIGRKNDASFRLIVTDSRRGPKSGKHIDLLGSYNPKLNDVNFDGEKAKKWIAQGVQVSDTVHNLLVSQKIIEGKKINVLPRKSPIIDEEKIKAEKEAKEAEETKKAEKAEEAETVEENVKAAEESPSEEVEASKDTETEVVKSAPEEEKETTKEETTEEVKEEVKNESSEDGDKKEKEGIEK